MLNFYKSTPPNQLSKIVVGGICPYCKTGTRYKRTTDPSEDGVREKPDEIVITYSCELCLRPIPINWRVTVWDGYDPYVDFPEVVIPTLELFDFDHGPQQLSGRSGRDKQHGCASVRDLGTGPGNQRGRSTRSCLFGPRH